MFQFKKAERKQRKFKGCIAGVSGAGKTWTALEIAKGLANGGKIALIDTEQSSAALYADNFTFDACDLTETTVKNYIQAIEAAANAGYDVLVIDSLSHAWEYLLEEVDNVQARNRGTNSFTAWKSVTPIYKQLVEAIVRAPIHIIATMRAKSDYVMEEVEGKDGRTRSVPKKVGLAPVFRQGGEYEFDFMATIDLEHRLCVEKSRLPQFADKVVHKPDHRLGVEIADWLAGGAPEEKPSPAPSAVRVLTAAAAAGDIATLGAHRIETNCSKRGELVEDLVTYQTEWVRVALTKPNLAESDRVALQAVLAARGEDETQSPVEAVSPTAAG